MEEELREEDPRGVEVDRVLRPRLPDERLGEDATPRLDETLPREALELEDERFVETLPREAVRLEEDPRL